LVALPVAGPLGLCDAVPEAEEPEEAEPVPVGLPLGVALLLPVLLPVQLLLLLLLPEKLPVLLGETELVAVPLPLPVALTVGVTGALGVPEAEEPAEAVPL
jgi:hypothetical protein